MTPAEAKVRAKELTVVLTDLLRRKSDLDNQIAEAMNLKGEALRIVANDASPFKVGERVLWACHGDKISVEIIDVMTSVGDESRFTYHVKMVKKDGTLFKNSIRLWSWDNENLSKMEDK